MPRCSEGAASERAFSIGVESTVIHEARLLLEPYTDFSRALRSVHTSDPLLARAAQDTAAVHAQIASMARADADPCTLARSWQAAGWSRTYFNSIAANLDAMTSSRIARDAEAAAQRLEDAGISGAIAQSFALSINPIADA